MSRHQIPARDPNHEVIVGWDRPLQTFFVQVYDKRKKGTDDELIMWCGASRPRELYEVEDVRRVVGQYAELTADMASTLYGDKDEGR
jgi:hypothetical protein